MNILRLFIGCSFLVLIWTSCVETLDYSAPESKTLVIVDGLITNSEGERSIRVRKGNGLDSLSFTPIEIRGEIYRNEQFWGDLLEESKGVLRLPDDFRIESGNTYSVKLTTPDGNIYSSRPELVPPKIISDSLTFDLEREIFVTPTSNVATTKLFLYVNSHVNLQGQAPSYMLWLSDGVYSFMESVPPAFTCYIPYSVERNPVKILSSEGLNGQIKMRVVKQAVDQSMLFKHVFNVYLHSINESTYSFYERVLRLNNLDGSLYDEVPGPLRGNISAETEDEEVVVGQLSFAVVDTLRLRVLREEIRSSIFNRCLVPNPCGIFGAPCICNACQTIFPQASLEPPEYWDE